MDVLDLLDGTSSRRPPPPTHVDPAEMEEATMFAMRTASRHYTAACDEGIGREATDTGDEGLERMFTLRAHEMPEYCLNADDKADYRLFLPDPTEVAAVTTYCDKTELDALQYIVKKSKEASDKAYPQLVSKYATLGFTEKDVQRVLQYLRDEAPIIIHVALEADGRIDKMLADTHYRNQFETKISRGSLEPEMGGERWKWEQRCFNKIYDSSPAFRRPKYGTLNIVNDPKGISSAGHYGRSYFVMKGCRLRATITDMDSSCCNCRVSSCEHMAHVVSSFNDEELKIVVDVALGRKHWHDSQIVYNYKEVQIHGEVRMAENIDMLAVSPQVLSEHPDLEPKLKEFCRKNNCEYYVIPEGPNEDSNEHRDKMKFPLPHLVGTIEKVLESKASDGSAAKALLDAIGKRRKSRSSTEQEQDLDWGVLRKIFELSSRREEDLDEDFLAAAAALFDVVPDSGPSTRKSKGDGRKAKRAKRAKKVKKAKAKAKGYGSPTKGSDYEVAEGETLFGGLFDESGDESGEEAAEPDSEEEVDEFMLDVAHMFDEGWAPEHSKTVAAKPTATVSTEIHRRRVEEEQLDEDFMRAVAGLFDRETEAVRSPVERATPRPGVYALLSRSVGVLARALGSAYGRISAWSHGTGHSAAEEGRGSTDGFVPVPRNIIDEGIAAGLVTEVRCDVGRSDVAGPMGSRAPSCDVTDLVTGKSTLPREDSAMRRTETDESCIMGDLFGSMDLFGSGAGIFDGSTIHKDPAGHATTTCYVAATADALRSTSSDSLFGGFDLFGGDEIAGGSSAPAKAKAPSPTRPSARANSEESLFGGFGLFDDDDVFAKRSPACPVCEFLVFAECTVCNERVCFLCHRDTYGAHRMVLSRPKPVVKEPPPFTAFHRKTSNMSIERTASLDCYDLF